MRAILLACGLSITLYVAGVALVFDRPLTHGMLAAELDAKLSRGAAIAPPKLVILAGSNGPFSHRCEVLERLLARPCINGGIAVGIGLDYLFARWDTLLRPGDIVYLPMEPSQYTRGRLANATGPDAAIMARRDRVTLAGLGPERWVGAAFAYDLRGIVMAGLEMLLHAAGFRDPRAAAGGATNAWGDHVGHDAAGAARDALALMSVSGPAALEIANGHGAALIGAFTRRMSARGVLVLGGLSAGFDDVPLSDGAIAAMEAIYTGNGGQFVMLASRSRYPRADFFDGPEHLHEAAQIAHSHAVAEVLRASLPTPRRLSGQ